MNSSSGCKASKCLKWVSWPCFYYKAKGANDTRLKIQVINDEARLSIDLEQMVQM